MKCHLSADIGLKNNLFKFYKISASLIKIKTHCTLVHSARFLVSKKFNVIYWHCCSDVKQLYTYRRTS